MLAHTDLRRIADLLHERAGILLTDDKAYLVESRLGPVARRFGFASLAELAAAIDERPLGTVAEAVIEAMTTNETSFFRDGYPFDLLRQVILPSLLRDRIGSRRLRIWSAAAATGQEVYSIAFCLEEIAAALESWEVDLVGTDLSTEALARAREGRYSHFEIQRGLPIQLLVRHFERAGSEWRIKRGSCRPIRFERHNLLDDAGRLGRFDVIFLRNALIYMDMPTKQQVLTRIAAVVAPDGYLILGGTETTLGITGHFHPASHLPGLYRPAGALPEQNTEQRGVG